eukprot:sb/3471915/
MLSLFPFNCCTGTTATGLLTALLAAHLLLNRFFRAARGCCCTTMSRVGESRVGASRLQIPNHVAESSLVSHTPLAADIESLHLFVSRIPYPIRSSLKEISLNKREKTEIIRFNTHICISPNTTLPNTTVYSRDRPKHPIKTRYLGHVTGYQPISDQYILIRLVPAQQNLIVPGHA